MDVNSQILYAEMKWDEIEKSQTPQKNGLNNVKHAGKG